MNANKENNNNEQANFILKQEEKRREETRRDETNSVAHIMNDETTRKYLQSIKRLMTLCQRRYPSLPSKSVEFNSLANGSDLHSLLLEEKQKTTSQNAEERLRIMAGPVGKESI